MTLPSLCPSQNGRVPIHLAAEWGRVEAVLALIEVKADVLVKDNVPRTSPPTPPWLTVDMMMNVRESTCLRMFPFPNVYVYGRGGLLCRMGRLHWT